MIVKYKFNKKISRPEVLQKQISKNCSPGRGEDWEGGGALAVQGTPVRECQGSPEQGGSQHCSAADSLCNSLQWRLRPAHDGKHMSGELLNGDVFSLEMRREKIAPFHA